MFTGGVAVDLALGPEMFLQAPPSCCPALGTHGVPKPGQAQAAGREAEQPLPPASEPPLSQAGERAAVGSMQPQ